MTTKTTNLNILKIQLSLNSLQLFASKYKLYLPTEDELRKEIENQKNIFYLQQKD